MSEKVYPEGLVGRKIGMTQVFTAEGQAQPVTVVEIGPCCVLDVKQSNTHGYNAVQLGFMEKKPQRVNRAEMGHFKRAGTVSYTHLTLPTSHLV